MVAEGVAHSHVDSVEVLDRFLGELDTAGLQRLIQRTAVIRGEGEPAHRALGYQVADLLRRCLVHRGWAGRIQEDVRSRLARNSDRQPARGTLLEVVADLEPELAGVELEGFILVEDEDAGDSD